MSAPLPTYAVVLNVPSAVTLNVEAETEREACIKACRSAWNKNPAFGVIGVQSGPP